MRHVCNKTRYWRWDTVALTATLTALVAGCNTTSDIDTTLGTVSSDNNQTLLPPPVRPEVAELAAQGDNAVANGIAQPTTTVEPVQIEQAAASEVSQPRVDDMVPTLTMRNTGTFPNINEERAPSLRQFTPEERAALSEYMNELAALHQQGQLSTTQYERRLAYLQNLARTHSRDALRQIGAL